MNANLVAIGGNLTRDVDVKYTQNNKAVASFGIAINSRYKAADGTPKEETTFVDCEAWGATAETIGKFFTKGKPIYVVGRLKTDTWQDKETGANRSKMKVVVDSFQFVGKPDGAPSGGGQTKNPLSQGQKQNIRQTVGAGQPPVDDDESIPF